MIEEFDSEPLLADFKVNCKIESQTALDMFISSRVQLFVCNSIEQRFWVLIWFSKLEFKTPALPF